MLLGSVIDVRLEQSIKQYHPIEIMLLGNVIDVRLEHS